MYVAKGGCGGVAVNWDPHSFVSSTYIHVEREKKRESENTFAHHESIVDHYLARPLRRGVYTGENRGERYTVAQHG